MNSNSNRWRWFFILAALEAGAAFATLALVPHEGEGFSVSRLGLLAVLLGTLLVWIFLAARVPGQMRVLARPAYVLGSGLLAVAFATTLFLLRYLNLRHLTSGQLLPYYQRLSPLLFYLLFLALTFMLFGLVEIYGLHGTSLLEEKSTIRYALIAFGILAAVFLFVAWTRLGLTPDSAYWGEPGVPVMGWQFGLMFLGGLCALLLSLRVPDKHRLDAALGGALWITAVVIWLSVPNSVMQSSFYAPVNPPANQPFPYSDAGYYDTMAQSLLMGYPYLGQIPTRPLYILVLTGLHALVGQRYNLIIAGQTLILAFIPVLLYLLGRKLHSRMAGVMVALFAIFREWTSLQISSQTRVSNSKTLLVDLPTLLLVLLACLFALRWLDHRDEKSALVAGGAFGMLLLLRTQSMLILSVLFLLVILSYGWRNRAWLGGLGFFLAGFAAAVTPWLLHNYLASGHFTFDAPFQYQVIASQYQYTGNLDLGSVNLEGKGLAGMLLTFLLKDPKFVLGFIATHFLATQIDGLLALPLFQPFHGLNAPINLYWMNWDGQLSWVNLLLILVYLALIGIGLGAAWKRWRWVGLVPLSFSLGYSLANGIGRFSGWRYDLPADWISYFYFGIGLAEILGVLAFLFGARENDLLTSAKQVQGDATAQSARRQRHKFSVTLASLMGCFALIGGLPWAAEGIAQPRYSGQTADVLQTRLSSSAAVQNLGVDRAQIEKFLAAPDADLQIGRLVYPRYFTRGDGLSSTHPWPAYEQRDFPRLGFLLLSQGRQDAVFATRDVPEAFESGVDVIVLGCRRQDHLDVRLIFFPGADSAYQSQPLSTPCN